MDNFKFFKGTPTTQELKDYAWRYSHQYRFHPVGCLISKSIYKLFVGGPIIDGEVTTYEEVEELINSNVMTPEEYIEMKRLQENERDYEENGLDLHQDVDPLFESI